ncbi:testis-specific protein TSX-like [Microtus ochrogaster]|uniref:Testis-specific protein TSX-like n=1 Tax=Microtus ochrogaster TaxID=79684 RepID=A0ABM1TTS7_MICOH|nr:testis-specific protein TSX-like [Microtus ochrogaster]
MSEEQTPQMSETECRTVDSPEFEDEERWLYKVLGIKLMPSSALDPWQFKGSNGTTGPNSKMDDDMETQEDKSLGEMLTDLNSEGEQDVKRTAPDNAMNPTD